MDIRDLQRSEAGCAVALWGECGLTRPWNDPHADLTRALDGATSTVLAAWDGPQLFGTVMVGHDGHRGWSITWRSARPSAGAASAGS